MKKKSDLVQETLLRVLQRVSRGEPVASIVETARSMDADLIVMGTHGKAGTSAFWAGSINQRTKAQPFNAGSHSTCAASKRRHSSSSRATRACVASAVRRHPRLSTATCRKRQSSDRVAAASAGSVFTGWGDACSGTGDCVDCKQCVAVCPTGIDIRNGLQMECVHCTACVWLVEKLPAVLPGVDESTMPRRFMLMQDPPNHTRLRRLVSRAFTPPAIERLRPHVQALVGEMLDAVVAKGSFKIQLGTVTKAGTEYQAMALTLGTSAFSGASKVEVFVGIGEKRLPDVDAHSERAGRGAPPG